MTLQEAIEAYENSDDAVYIITSEQKKLILDAAREYDALRKQTEWQDIESAPFQKQVLIWWKPKGENIYAECHAVAERCLVDHPHEDEGYGEYKPGCWWSNGRYYNESHISAWMPLPSPPLDRPKES